jgi:poly(hydroxyalkanoate) depolymerase family esterase
MDKQMREGMLEATRLTRAGRLLEATAAIQRTLRGVRAPAKGDDAISQPTDEIIEGAFWVNDSPPDSTQVRAQQPEPGPSTASVSALALPPPSAPTAPQPADSPAERTNSQASPGTAPSTFSNLFLERERAARTPPAFRPVKRQHGRGQRAGSTGQFLSASYRNAAGTRAYKLYIPSGYHGQALPLVVMLHGCTQTADDFAVGTRMNEYAEAQRFFVAYPSQASSANRSTCWNWFKPADQSRDQGEPSLLAGITRQVGRAYAVDSRCVYLAGLSAGGAMAAIMGMTYPDLYAAIGIHSGLAYGSAHDVPSALAAMQQGAAAPAMGRTSGMAGACPNAELVPIIVFHGDRDMTVNPRNADQLMAQWAAIYRNDGSNRTPEMRVQQGQVVGGQAFTRVIYSDAAGQVLGEQWLVHGAGHGWSGGSPSGSFTNPSGPDATQEMLRFFAAHAKGDG